MTFPAPTAVHARHSRRRLLAALVALLVAFTTLGLPSVVAPPPAEASTNPANQAVRGLQTWYMYVAPGEEPSVQFHKIAATTGGWGPNTAIVVRDPQNTVQYSCTVNSTTTPVSTLLAACTYQPLIIAANQTGIWSVSIEQGAGTTAPTQNLGQNRLTWSIGTRADAISPLKPGRVWTESLVTADDITDFSAGRTVNMTLFYQSRQGFTYRIVRQGVLGIDAAYSANAFGVVNPATCSSVHESIATNGPTTYRPVGTSGCSFSPYKIFFEAPAADLPASATLPNGTVTWLRAAPPTAADLDVDLAFTPSAPGARSGAIGFTVANFEGTLDLRVDVDDDGVFTGPADRSLTAPVVTGRATSVPFDGLTAQGAPISTTTPLAVQVAITRLGEIHLLDSDVEFLPNGVIVERLNGPATNRFDLSWNDSKILSELPAGQQKCSTTSPLIGDHADSSTGVHRWGQGTCTTAATTDARYYNSNPAQALTSGFAGSWGNLSEIDRWASVTVDRRFAFEVPAFEIAKTSVPATTTTMKAGEVVGYTVTAKPIRYAHPPAATASSEWNPASTWSGRLTDALASVADNADLQWSSIAATPAAGSAIVTDQAAARFTWTGTGIPVAQSVDIRYSATVRSTQPAGSDRLLRNIAYVHTGATPPAPPSQCLPRVCGTTQHPIGVGDVRLEKVDATSGTGLAGARFQLWRDVDRNGALDPAVDVAVGAAVTTDTTGTAVWAQLLWDRYLVQEVEAPTGYAISDPAVRAVTLDAASLSLTVQNDRLPGRVTWTKVGDDGARTALAGSEWSLRRGGDAPVTVTDCVGSPCTGEDADPVAGAFRVDDLDWGGYTLQETTAPAGYVLDTTPHEFTVGATALDVGLAPIVNRQQPPLILPFTGGMSADAFTIAGLGGAVIAMATFALRRIRRRRAS